MGLGPKVVERDEAISQADRMGGFTIDTPTGVQQLERPLLADEGRQRGREPKAMMETKPGEVCGKPSLRCSDAKVSEAGEAETATDCRALHCSNCRCTGGKQVERGVIEVAW